MYWGCPQTLQGLEKSVSQRLSGVEGCFFLHPGVRLRKRPWHRGCCAAPQCTSRLYVVRLINYTHRPAQGRVSPTKVKLREWPRGLSASAESIAPQRGFLVQRAVREAGFGTSLVSDGDESVRYQTDGPNLKGEKEKVSR